jgi:hypothetical protein
MALLDTNYLQVTKSRAFLSSDIPSTWPRDDKTTIIASDLRFFSGKNCDNAKANILNFSLTKLVRRPRLGMEGRTASLLSAYSS